MMFFAVFLACSSEKTKPIEYPLELGACDAWDVQTLTKENLIDAGKEFEMLRQMGMQYARPHRPSGHVFSFDVVRGPMGTDWDWELPDLIVKSAQKNQMKLLITLDNHIEYTGNAPIQLSVSEDEMSNWLIFVAALIERYDGDGNQDMPGLTQSLYAVEIGNEPSCPPTDVSCHERYRLVVQNSSEVIRKASDTVLILMGGAAPLFKPSQKNEHRDIHKGVEALYRYLFANLPKGTVDALPFHMMVGSFETNLEQYVVEWRTIAGETPLWLTEVGVHRSHGQFQPALQNPDKAVVWTDNLFSELRELEIPHIMWCRAGGAWDENKAIMDILKINGH